MSGDTDLTAEVQDERSDFERYVDDGIPMARMLTPDESEYVYRNLK